jgi:peptide/nickel transport system permease protein
MYVDDPRISAEDLARLSAYYGFDKPLPLQYLTWLGNVLRGDFGFSFASSRPVSQMIFERLPNTLLLMFSAMLVQLIVVVPLGVYSATHQYSRGDFIITSFAFFAYAMPAFWLGLMAIMIFGVFFKSWGLPYLPTGGMYSLSEGPTLVSILRHMVLPTIILGVTYAAPYIRYLRSSMLEVNRQDYIITARAKGLSEVRIRYQHALKKAAIPAFTVLMLQIPHKFGGSLIIEQVFAWPGIGRLFWEHSVRHDYPVVMAILLMVSVLVILFSLITDLIYVYLDPRIRYT